MTTHATEAAITRWDELLERDEAVGRLAELRASLAARGLELEGRPLCRVLRPHFVTEEDLRSEAALAEHLIGAVHKLRAGVEAGGRRLPHFESFRQWMSDLAALEGQAAGDGALLRLDASLARTQLHFIELNSDMPHGAGHNDLIAGWLEDLDAFRRFSREWSVRPLQLQQPMLEALLAGWREWGGTGSPSIAVVGWSDDPVRLHNARLDCDHYASQGYEARPVDPRDLAFSGGRLRDETGEIDLVHRVVSTAECLSRPDEVRPLVEAMREGAVCLVNPFRSELLGHKAIFALLTDREHDFSLTAAERRAIDRHVPWARVAAEGAATDRHGERIDLGAYAREHRERLVLKPTHDFGGHGVRLGWRESEEDWERSWAAAVDGDYIVQERVALHRETYPTLEGEAETFYEDTDPFLFHGELRGFLTRLSRSEITNVHSEGSVVASFVLGPGA